MQYSLLGKRSLCTKYFTSVWSKPYCNSTGIGKEDTLKEIKNNDDVIQDKSLKEKLEHTFNTKMKNDVYPLFSDFNTYEKWMPVRRIGSGYRKLYELPHYTKEQDLDILVKKLEELPIVIQSTRIVVKYFAAPGASGKTCAVLPAFLRSAEKKGGFTHYIYLAFDNNNRRNFKAFPNKPDDDNLIAYNQGATFIVNCLEKMLNDENPDNSKANMINIPGFAIDINRAAKKAEEYMEELIEKLSKGGKKPRILFHVDEHKKMCTRTGEKNDPGAFFSKGAMSTLAMAIGEKSTSSSDNPKIPVTVIATFTDKPDLPPFGSSGVCRAPAGLPPIDIERVMKVTKLKDEKGNYYYPFHFPFDKKNLDRVEKRLFATLKFKLAMKLSELGFANLHYNAYEYKKLCKDFNSIIIGTKQDLKEKLIACSELCNIELQKFKSSKYATELLLGITEETYEEILTKKRLVNRNLLVCNDIWTASLKSLLTLTEANKKLQFVHGGPRSSMLSLMENEPCDYLSNTPLEVAYRWTLACKGAKENLLKFDSWTFAFEPTQVKEGRIFDSEEIIQINDVEVEKKVKQDTLYYMQERPGYKTHPLFDLFFLCKAYPNFQDTLVMIDITGGGILTAEDKLAKLSKWIGEQKLEKYSLKGIVLAPGAKIENKFAPNAAIIGQRHAMLHLGGLQQIYRWFLDEEDEVDVLNKE